MLSCELNVHRVTDWFLQIESLQEGVCQLSWDLVHITLGFSALKTFTSLTSEVPAQNLLLLMVPLTLCCLAVWGILR